MKRIKRVAALLAAVLFTGLLVSDAQAQMGGMGGMGGGRRGGSMRGGDSPPGEGRPAPRPPDANSAMQVEIHLSQLQTALKLRPDQSAPWQAFAGRVRALTEDIARERGLSMDLRPGADAGPLTGMKHISRAVDTARNRLTALEEVEAAAGALYKTLTPEQKAIADVRVPEVVMPRPFVPVGDAPNG